ncbi:hypothetical protein MMC26_002973 [Xylographa opegraphella]|nr:hypothetical protein [Xylographa opegraphella]
MDREQRRRSGIGTNAEEDLVGLLTPPENMMDIGLSPGQQTWSRPVSRKREPCAEGVDVQYKDNAVETLHSGGSTFGFDGGTAREPRVEGERDHVAHVPPRSMVRTSSPAHTANLISASNVSSPLHSAYASSASLGSFEVDDSASGDIEDHRPGAIFDAPSAVITHARTAYEAPSAPALSPIVTSQVQPASHLRRDGPHYPNQSFAALQSQYYPPPYQSHPLRTRSSNPSQNSFYSSVSLPQSRDRTPMIAGARTAGNTPAQSPGLFSPSTSAFKMVDDHEEGSQYNTPLLHPSHLVAPKETHKLLKDVDPISGRKIVNNYEFQAKLGSGAHGTVKLGRNLNTDEYVAIKIVRRFSKKIRLGKQESPEDKVKKEVAVLKKARHPHVVSLLEVIDDPEFGKVYLILEYVELGEIIWRTVADRHVAVFERDRVKQEMAGNVTETLEAEAVTYFNQGLPTRRLEKQRVLTEKNRVREAKYAGKHGVGTKKLPMPAANASSYWSLEMGGDSPEDEMGHLARSLNMIQVSENNSRSASVENLPTEPTMSNTSSRTGTPAPTEARAFSAAEADVALVGAGSPSSSLSRMALEGTMWGPYAAASENTADCIAAVDRIFTEHSNLLEADEEYKYVPCLTLSQALDAFRDTVLGLEYLHYQGIIHRDIKPANLLWTKDHRVKISDFGVSYLGRPIREDDNKEEIEEADAANLDEAIELAKTVGTPAFYAPELCDPDLFDIDKNPERPQITGQIDVWALGVTLYGMIFGRLPFFDDNEFAMYEKIARQEVFIPGKRLRGVETNPDRPLSPYKRQNDVLAYEDVDDELRDLLGRLLHKQASKRITLKEVKHHPWVLRGIKDHSAWIDETDPSLQSQGRKIEVSTQEVNEAVAPLTIVDRIKSGIRRLNSVVRGQNSRKRAESNVKNNDTSHGERQSRRTSLRGDEQIYTALRASRENTEHPLAQSLAASPELREDLSYFPNSTTTLESIPSSSTPHYAAQRPKLMERAISTADSTKTIRAPVPTTIVRQSTPPVPADDQLQSSYIGDSAASSSSSLSGIFSGAGRRLVKGMRSRERGQERDTGNQASRSSSVENMASNFEDPHASPSIAISPAIAAGHVDQPPILRDALVEPQPRHAPIDFSTLPIESSTDAFAKAQEQNYRRHMLEQERSATQPQQRSRANTAYQCPPSPDDYAQIRRGSQHSQDALMAISSSDDQMTSGISESFSHPSIPSVVSGASSLATTGEELNADATPSIMSSGQTIIPDHQDKIDRVTSSRSLDEDEAGYNGDGDEAEEESDDDGCIMFVRK